MAQAGWHGRLSVAALVGALLGSGCWRSNDDAPALEIGDTTDDGGTVTQVTPMAAQCISVTVEMPPAWACSDEEKVLARGSSSGASPSATTPPVLADPDVSLEP